MSTAPYGSALRRGYPQGRIFAFIGTQKTLNGEKINFKRKTNMKCSCCGEEVGTASVCPVCGASLSAQPRENACAETYTRPAAGGVAGGKRYEGVSGNRWGEYFSSLFAGGQNGGNGAPAAQGDENGILEKIAEEKAELVEECSKCVSKVVVESTDMISSGTGWCGYGDYIFTNAHVVETATKPGFRKMTCEFSDKLHLGNQQVVPVDLIYYSAEEDIAILLPKSGRLPGGVKVLKIDDTPTKQGQLVFTIGNPLHYKFTYMEGAVANPDYNSGGKRKFKVLQTTLTLNHGNSGGPVMNAKGDVVGMATFSELEKETESVLNPIALISGDEAGLFQEVEKYKDILGYGFCVKSEAIFDAIRKTEQNRRR